MYINFFYEGMTASASRGSLLLGQAWGVGLHSSGGLFLDLHHMACIEVGIGFWGLLILIIV